MIAREAFNNMLMNKTSCSYDDYGLVSWKFLGLGVEGMPKEAE